MGTCQRKRERNSKNDFREYVHVGYFIVTVAVPGCKPSACAVIFIVPVAAAAFTMAMQLPLYAHRSLPLNGSALDTSPLSTPARTPGPSILNLILLSAARQGLPCSSVTVAVIYTTSFQLFSIEGFSAVNTIFAGLP